MNLTYYELLDLLITRANKMKGNVENVDVYGKLTKRGEEGVKGLLDVINELGKTKEEKNANS
jgi:hypothetical protein